MRLFLSSTAAGGTFLVLFSCHRLSSSSTISSSHLLKLKNLNYRYRRRAISEAQVALTEYLHGTRSLPFSIADHIASNSPISLSTLVFRASLGEESPTQYARVLRSFLSYHPVNEFEFFFESIGLSLSHPSVASRSPIFLSDDAPLLAAVSSLLRFGFPWTRLGVLYLDSPSIFSLPPGQLLSRLQGFESLGLRRLCVIAICLAFPSSLSASADDSETELLFRDLRTVLVDYGLECCAGGDVEALFRFCRRIGVFYELGSEKGTMGEIMGQNREIIVQLDEFVLAQKLKFLLNLGLRREEVGVFALKNCKIFYLDLNCTYIIIPDYLLWLGLGKEEVDSLMKRCPFVKGKNKLGSLPGIMKALDLDKWFLTKVVCEKNLHFLILPNEYVDSCHSRMEAEFMEDLERLKLMKKQPFIDAKVEFFLSIGFGKNNMTSKVVRLVHGNQEKLQERLDCLIGLGISYPVICRMICAQPKLINQSKELIWQKVNYLIQDLGYDVQYLDSFPAFLMFHLEKRVKPRYRILNWLKDLGLLKHPLAPATVLANSQKKFIFTLSCIHPAAPKQWLECFSSRSDSSDQGGF
ncbi:hypothetical protein AXF42_Ash012994 [Apostasia shenzhenica]|uniref:Transcription termination factor MTEF18, mitochondrial n=1 Tax=Apostasia shenzhenica TaxID=1088818 RepID=A0A2I0ARV2_9ASPA|nr:hypothetical protein AXF42_Ash012994 [Apostasia shenzhenica]